MGKIKLSQTEVSQTINLNEIVKTDLSLDPALVNKIGQDIIDLIRSRTESGKEIGGERDLKKPYSESYSDSLPFKAAGKSKNKIDMTLTGDMLGSIDLAENDPESLKIEVDPSQAPKAYNHNVGDTVPKRPWFGVTRDELMEILDRHKEDISAIKEDRADVIQSLRTGNQQQTLIDVFRRNGFFGDDDEL